MLGFHFTFEQLCNEVVGVLGAAGKNKGKIRFDELNEALLIKMSSQTKQKKRSDSCKYAGQ